MTRVALVMIRILLCAATLLGGAPSALAQTGPYLDTSVAAINSSTPCNAGGLITRTITVADSFTIADLDVGLIATHAWRTDVRFDLTSPQGTSVRLLEGPANIRYTNYNIRLDDEAGFQVNNSPHTGADNVSAPPYEIDVSPDNALSAFDGENAQGDWTIEICDTFPAQDDGEYRRSELIFTPLVGADLSLAKTASQQSPAIGANVVFTLTVSNAGPEAATGVEVRDLLPSGLAYVSDNGGGAYNPTSGVWSAPGSISAGGSAALQITANVSASGSYSNLAEVIASDQTDVDSTPDNSGTDPFEDDTDVVTLTPGGGGGGPPPALSCGASAVNHDWNANNWPSTSLSESYVTGGETLDFTVSGSTGDFVNFDAGVGPLSDDYYTGGLAGSEQSVLLSVNYDNANDFVRVTIDIGTPGVGVDELQLALFDLDFGAGQFTDEVQVFGYLNGALVVPTLTTSAANSATTFVVTGVAAASQTSSDGTATVTFQSPVDQVVLVHRSGAGAPADPGNQGVAIHDLNWCPRTVALSAQKTVSVIATDGIDAATCAGAPDPGANDQYAVPGACVQYQISVTNPAGGPAATDIDLADTLPAAITYAGASQSVFAGGTIRTTDAAPTPNPITCTASTPTCVVRLENASLASGATGVLTIRGLVE